jgi:hypothetical protein
MKDDLLSEAARALRETEPVSEIEARATRSRVLAGLHQTRVRRRTRLTFLLPIAASFVAVSAWGAASGQARVVLDKLERLVGLPGSNPISAPAVPRHLPDPVRFTAEPPEKILPTSSPEAESVPVPPIAASAASAPHPPPSVGSAAGRAQRAEAALALYRIAHTAHFAEHDPSRALAAWDVYLGAAPNGEFAPEARYNRALCLVRLGRAQEARSALEPFANGAYGSYRKAEASALLERIDP